MSKHDINNDELLKHLQEERERNNSSVPSLVGLIEGDKNSILSPTMAWTIIIGCFSVIVAGTGWVIRTDNNMSALEADNLRLQARQEQMYDDLNTFKESFKSSVQDNMKVNSNTLNELSNRVTELYAQVSSDAKLSTSAFEQKDAYLEASVLDIKQQIIDLKSDIRGLEGLETQIKILEIRYENLVKE